MSDRIIDPLYSVIDEDGNPLVGAKLYFYATGTTSPLLATYSDRARTILNTNPVISNDSGRFGAVFVAPGVEYNVVLKDKDENQLEQEDPMWAQDIFTAADIDYTNVNGGTVTVESKLDELVSPADFGIVGDKVADDTTGIQDFIDYSEAAGGGFPDLGEGDFRITDTLVISGDSTILKGAGAAYDSDTAGAMDDSAATAIHWDGAAGVPMLQVTAVSGAGNPVLRRSGVMDIHFNCNNVASKAIEVSSVRSGMFQRLSGRDATDVMFELNVVAALSEARDTQHCKFTDLSIRQVLSTNGVGIRVTGDTGANASLNYFDNIEINHDDGAGLELGSSDGNTFILLRGFRQPGGTGYGIEFMSGTTTDHSRNNQIYSMDMDAGVIARAGTQSSSQNSIYGYNTGNGAPLPVVESGATLTYITDAGQSFISSDSLPAYSIFKNSSNLASIGEFSYRALNDAGANIRYSYISSRIADNTASSEAARMEFINILGGSETLAGYVGAGLVMGNPTDGDIGAGTINAEAVYDDHVLLTCYPVEAWQEGSIDQSKWDATIKDDREHEPSKGFADVAQDRLDPEKFGSYLKEYGHLPAMPSPDKWKEKKYSSGEIIQGLWETTEILSIHITKLCERIKKLED